MARKRFKIELLATAEGLHLGDDAQKKKDTIVVLLWCKSKKEAEEKAKKLAEALLQHTHLGNIEYVVQSVKYFQRHPASAHI